MKKFSHFIPLDYSMYDTSYCTEKGCLQSCARRKKCPGIHTVSDFPPVCKEYVTTYKKLQKFREKQIKELCKLINKSVKQSELEREYLRLKKKVRFICLSQKKGCEECPFANHDIGYCKGTALLEEYVKVLDKEK